MIFPALRTCRSSIVWSRYGVPYCYAAKRHTDTLSKPSLMIFSRAAPLIKSDRISASSSFD